MNPETKINEYEKKKEQPFFTGIRDKLSTIFPIFTKKTENESVIDLAGKAGGQRQNNIFISEDGDDPEIPESVLALVEQYHNYRDRIRGV